MDAAITEERKMSLDACIVRTMKARTTLQHSVTPSPWKLWPVVTLALLTLLWGGGGAFVILAARRGDR
jgi:hypothetical protein